MNLVFPIRLAPLAVLAALLLTGCTGDTGTAPASSLTLAQAKSNVQLLRNNAAARIPEELVDVVLVSIDLSAGCDPETSDPEGIIRAWHSGARVSLVANADPDAVVEGLVQSFVDQGWEESMAGTGSVTTLSNAAIFTDIEITTKNEDVDAGKPAEIVFALTSPCVVTDGEGSSEVTELEAMAY